MKVYSQLEKAQLENTTSDTASLPKGMITYRTDLNIAKVSNGTSMLALIDESSTQTLSGKTYASPNFTGFSNWAQTTTPATPSAGNNRMYFKADGKLYTLDSAGNEAQVGSGAGGGVKNLITNGSADDTAASIFVPYADAASTRPVDGTGGSPTVTTSVTTTTPLDGTKAFLLTKPASNVQGQGWAVPFTVDPAYRAKSLKISADYIINSGTFVPGNNSGTPADGDLIWYIYDVTNSQLIEPSNIKMFSSDTGISDKFEATFQTSVSGSSYRLIAHVASTSALAFEIKLDNVTVSPQVYVFGTPVTDWQAYTPTYVGLGTVTTDEAFWRRVGDSIELRGRISLGTTTGTTASISLPPGMAISTTKELTTTLYGQVVNQNDTTNTFVALAASGATAINIGRLSAGSLSTVVGTQVGASGNAVAWYVKGLPIQGFSSSVKTSDGFDGRVLTAKFVNTSSQSIPNDTLTTVTATTVTGTGGISIAPSGVGTVLSSGWYTFQGRVNFTANATGFRYSRLIKGVTEFSSGLGQTGTLAGVVFNASTVSGTEYFNAGDTFALQAYQNSGGALNLDNGGGNYLHVQKVNGPQTISESEKISFAVGHTSGQAVAATTNVVAICNVKEHDSHNIYNTSTGEFKFPRPGFVNIFARFLTGNFAGASPYYGQITLFKNGSAYKVVSGRWNPAAGTTTYAFGEGGVGFYSLPTDVWDIRVYYQLATSIYPGTDQCFITAEMA